MRLYRGFTLIELLVVIAIIGVLTAIVLAAINPVEQIARSRDASRESVVIQVGKALVAYSTNNNGIYTPAVSGAGNGNPPTGWFATLKLNGDIPNNNSLDVLFPGATATTSTSETGATANCVEFIGKDSNNFVNGLCYVVDKSPSGGADFMLYTPLESGLAKGHCTGSTYPIFVYIASLGGAGGLCAPSTTSAGVTTITSYGALFTSPTKFDFH